MCHLHLKNIILCAAEVPGAVVWEGEKELEDSVFRTSSINQPTQAVSAHASCPSCMFGQKNDLLTAFKCHSMPFWNTNGGETTWLMANKLHLYWARVS